MTHDVQYLGCIADIWLHMLLTQALNQESKRVLCKGIINFPRILRATTHLAGYRGDIIYIEYLEKLSGELLYELSSIARFGSIRHLLSFKVY